MARGITLRQPVMYLCLLCSAMIFLHVCVAGGRVKWMGVAVEVERSLGDVGSPAINLCLSPKKEVLANSRLISISKTLYFARTGIMLPRDPRPSRGLIMLIT